MVYEDQRGALREIVPKMDAAISAHLPALAADHAARLKAQTEARPRQPGYPLLLRDGVNVGDALRIDGKTVIVSSLGRKFKIDEDFADIGYSHLMGHEGEWAIMAHYRDPTPEEAQEQERRAALAAEKKAKAAADAAIVRRLSGLPRATGLPDWARGIEPFYAQPPSSTGNYGPRVYLDEANGRVAVTQPVYDSDPLYWTTDDPEMVAAIAGLTRHPYA
jgi:hypothetical protein